MLEGFFCLGKSSLNLLASNFICIRVIDQNRRIYVALISDVRMEGWLTVIANALFN
jgi:hypothetical protein